LFVVVVVVADLITTIATAHKHRGGGGEEKDSLPGTAEPWQITIRREERIGHHLHHQLPAKPFIQNNVWMQAKKKKTKKQTKLK
jgi:hypothetical protein